MLGEFHGFFIIKFKKRGKTLNYVSCFSLHFFRALTASCVPYNRTEHCQRFFYQINHKPETKVHK